MRQRVLVRPGRYELQDAPAGVTVTASAALAPACRHRLAPTGAEVECRCPRRPRLKVFGCTLHGACTPRDDGGVRVCAACPDRDPPHAEPTHPLVNGGALLARPAAATGEFPRPVAPRPHRPQLRWAYGVTTVPERRGDLLPRTLASLAAAGFDRPRLFVDGDADGPAWRAFGLECTFRTPRIRTHGNWLLALTELHVREPAADRYAIFQDDLVAARNLRRYLEQIDWPAGGYLNLLEAASNHAIAPKGRDGTRRVGPYVSNQCGKGAVALAFCRDAVLTLLASRHMQARCRDVMRGHRSVDGGIVESFKQAGQKEYCHHPSLVYHTGKASSMRNKPQPDAPSWRGEGWDAITLLEGGA